MEYLLQGPQPFKVGLTTVPTIFYTSTINTTASTVYKFLPIRLSEQSVVLLSVVYLQASDFSILSYNNVLLGCNLNYYCVFIITYGS